MNNRLYVGNLAYEVSEDVLRAEFAACGGVDDLKIMLDRDTGRPRGFAFVTMSTDADAAKAIQKLDGAMVDGRALRVSVAVERTAGGPPRKGHRGY